VYPEDRQILVQVPQLYFWMIIALQESKLSLKRLRLITFGKPKNKKRRKRVSDSDGGNRGLQVPVRMVRVQMSIWARG
jgi:hypothetical protein